MANSLFCELAIFYLGQSFFHPRSTFLYSRKNGETIQACFWMLEMSQVRKAWLLKKGEKVRKIYSVI